MHPLPTKICFVVSKFERQTVKILLRSSLLLSFLHTRVNFYLDLLRCYHFIFCDAMSFFSYSLRLVVSFSEEQRNYLLSCRTPNTFPTYLVFIVSDDLTISRVLRKTALHFCIVLVFIISYSHLTFLMLTLQCNIVTI